MSASTTAAIALTGAVEVPPRSHVIHDTLDGEQNALPILSIERRQGLRRVRLVEERRRVRLGHPCVAVLELIRYAMWDGVGWEDDPLDGVEDVKQQRSVHWGAEIKRHRV